MKSKTGMFMSIAAAALAAYASFGATADDGIKNGVHSYTPKKRYVQPPEPEVVERLESRQSPGRGRFLSLRKCPLRERGGFRLFENGRAASGKTFEAFGNALLQQERTFEQFEQPQFSRFDPKTAT